MDSPARIFNVTGHWGHTQKPVKKVWVYQGLLRFWNTKERSDVPLIYQVSFACPSMWDGRACPLRPGEKCVDLAGRQYECETDLAKEPLRHVHLELHCGQEQDLGVNLSSRGKFLIRWTSSFRRLWSKWTIQRRLIPSGWRWSSLLTLMSSSLSTRSRPE